MKYKYGCRNLFGFLVFLGLTGLLFSCHRKHEEEPPLKGRTVIVYMIGDNSLNSDIEPDINEMERGWNAGFDGHLIVYVDRTRTAPYVLEITADRSNTVVSPEVLKYSEQNSSSIGVMEKVLADIKNMYPAESYGLILWSHASGWLPATMIAPKTRVFGEDNGQYMEITELAGLSGKYDFLIFDACDMMGIESAYELRHNADYIVGSVTEILAGGFPYNEILEYLFMENPDLSSACRKFMEFYRSFSYSEMQTAAMSVVKTENLNGIASVSRDLIQKYKSRIAEIDVSTIQKYDSRTTTLFFDFLDFLENIAEDDADLQTLRNQLSSAVIFEDHTPFILD
ncbi:MAG: hypothetical protein LBQ70_00970, partial [Prevotellaceae bacterium]|nr:hypothetical protein [Prevotellaceae bacterium]